MDGLLGEWDDYQIIITSDYGSFPHSLLSTSKSLGRVRTAALSCESQMASSQRVTRLGSCRCLDFQLERPPRKSYLGNLEIFRNGPESFKAMSLGTQRHLSLPSAQIPLAAEAVTTC